MKHLKILMSKVKVLYGPNIKEKRQYYENKIDTNRNASNAVSLINLVTIPLTALNILKNPLRVIRNGHVNPIVQLKLHYITIICSIKNKFSPHYILNSSFLRQ